MGMTHGDSKYSRPIPQLLLVLCVTKNYVKTREDSLAHPLSLKFSECPRFEILKTNTTAIVSVVCYKKDDVKTREDSLGHSLSLKFSECPRLEILKTNTTAIVSVVCYKKTM